MLRGAGYLAREQNIILQHALQSTAMVAGHQGAAGLRILPQPEGSLAEQFLHAEATNLQLAAGGSLLHTVAPGIHAMERNLDLMAAAGRVSPPFPGRRANLSPSLAMATAGERRPNSPLRDPAHQWISQMSMTGEGGSGKGIRDSLATVWERGGEQSADAVKALAEHFRTDPENLSQWITEFRRVAANAGREESRERSLATLLEILESSRDQPQLLERLIQYFAYTANDFQAPQRELQGFSDLIEMGRGSLQLYERLGASLYAAQPRPFGREDLGGGYFLEISPGEGEAAGGLHVTLLRPEGNLLYHGGTPLAEIGVLVGQGKVQIVFVQGERGHYSAHVNRLRPLLGQDPFDWLIHGVAEWARSEGFKSLEAFGHTHNYWLRNRLAQMGEAAEGHAYRVHLSRLYEGRFLRLGLRPTPERPNLFTKDLPSSSGPENPSAVLALLTRILRPDPVLAHVQALIRQGPMPPPSPFDPHLMEKGRTTLLSSLGYSELRRKIVEHLLEIEESYPPQTLPEYILAAGYHAGQGRTPAQIIEILSERLAQGGKTQSFYRGLGQTELLLWHLGREVVGRRSNEEKIFQIENIVGEIQGRRGYGDLAKRAAWILERLKAEDPRAIRPPQDVFLEMIDLLRERSMDHMFFSRHPSEAASQFANIGGVLLRMDLSARLLTRMKPMRGQHVAFHKSLENLSLLIHRFRPEFTYQGQEERERALDEAPVLPQDLRFYHPSFEFPLYVPSPVVDLFESAMDYPPARHLKNQIWLRKLAKRLTEDFQQGRGAALESESLGFREDPEKAFFFLKTLSERGHD